MTPYDLAPVDPNHQRYDQGVLYYGFITLDQPNNSHYFITASASRTRRIPRDSVQPGPFLVPVVKK